MISSIRYAPMRVGNFAMYAVLITLGAVFLYAGPGARLWAAAVHHVPYSVLYIGGSFAIYLAIHWIVGGAMELLGAVRRPRSLYRHKLQSADQDAAPPTSRAIRLVLFNQLVLTGPGVALMYQLSLWRGLTPDAALPSPGTLVVELLAIMAIVEILFYACHWMFHRDWAYRRFHRVHHEYVAPRAFSFHYAHPVEHILCNLGPVIIAVTAVNCHPVTLFVFMLFAVLNGIVTHSGFNLPFAMWSVHHEFHHATADGNFSVAAVTDRLFGTDQAFRALVRDHDERAAAAAVGESLPH